MDSFFHNTAQTTGTHNVSINAVWTSSNTGVFSVSSHGLATALVSSGTSTITASNWAGQFSIVLMAAPPKLESVSLSPFNSSKGLGLSLTYTATPHYSDGSTTPLDGNSWSWSVNPTSSGTFAACASTTCQFTTNATTVGVAGISVTYNGVTGSTYLNIGLTGLSISPTTPATLPQDETMPFTANGTFSSGPPMPVTNSVRWTSSDSTIAKISNAIPSCGVCLGGVATAVASSGTANITAISGSVSSNTVALTVGPPVVTSLTISLSGCIPTSVPRGDTCQFTATGKYSNQATAKLTNSVTWNSDNLSCVTVNSSGLATTLAAPFIPPNPPCTANITATYTNVTPPNNPVPSNSIGVTVTAHVLNSISVSPSKPTQPNGKTQQFTLNGHYTDGIFAIPSGVSWSSTNSSVATIDSSSGLANTVAPGTATIKASYTTLSASTSFTVAAAALASIMVKPDPSGGYSAPTPSQPNTTIPIAGAVQLQAIGTYTDNSTQDVTSIAVWSSSTGATINDPNAPGEATGVSPGTPNITATDPNNPSVFGTMLLTVAAISSINVNPPHPLAVNPGQLQPFTATININGSTQDLTQFDPTWSSSANNVATVDQNGNATAVSAGTATIAVQLGAVSCPGGAGGGCATLTVNQPTLQSITVSCDPNNPCNGSGESVLQLGQTEQMIAIGNYSDGSTQDLTQNPHLTWGSTSGSVATIDATGFLTTQGLGSTNVTAACSSSCAGAPPAGVTGTLPLTVTF